MNKKLVVIAVAVLLTASLIVVISGFTFGGNSASLSIKDLK